MPFRLVISKVRRRGEAVAVVGRVVDGAVSGAEAVLVPRVGRPDRRSWVAPPGLRGSAGWPVRPRHLLPVTLSLNWDASWGEVDTGRALVGEGWRPTGGERLEIADALADPRFWAVVLWESLDAEDRPELRERFFRVSAADVLAWYRDVVERRFGADQWPFVRLRLDPDRYVELELVETVERQDRWWLGVGDRRVLAGYQSGHAALPAFRLEEALRAGAHLDPDAAAAATFLMLPGCSAGEVSPQALGAIAAALRRLPGVDGALAADVAAALANALADPGVRWTEDPRRGWVNDGPCSQRNPRGAGSDLGDDDYEALRRFFER